MVSEDQVGTPLDENISRWGVIGCIVLAVVVVAVVAVLIYIVTGLS